jgi:3-deoxy-7-phosphoheptulonate synthase
VDIDLLRALDIVEDVKRIQEPYKNANRKFHEEDTVIPVGSTQVGGDGFSVIAGPCSIESEEQLCLIAAAVKAAGATLLRGGAFKPRTSPYAFQGLRGHGLTLLLEAKKLAGLPVVTEIMDLSQLDLFADVDVIQVGARNMQNFEMLKELGRSGKPILIKRGLANTLQELLMSAEYGMAGGNPNVILCERGIRTFETTTRNTLDLSAVPMLKKMSHLPVIVDPSHATGIASLVKPMALAATVCGADGLMIEVHNDPKRALCDGAQSLTPEAFAQVMDSVRGVLPFACR